MDIRDDEMVFRDIQRPTQMVLYTQIVLRRMASGGERRVNIQVARESRRELGLGLPASATHGTCVSDMLLTASFETSTVHLRHSCVAGRL